MESDTIQKLKKNPQQLAYKLYFLLKKHNLNPNQVAQKLGIPMMTIRRLVLGETTDPRISTLKLIADHFNISIDSLLDEKKSSTLQPINKAKPHFVAVLDWGTVEKMKSINNLDLSNWKEWQPISLNEHVVLGTNAFALESRPSMYPRFPRGTIFIFDPDIDPADGDIVLVKIKKDNKLTLRELIIDPPEWQLHSIVPNSKMLQYSKKNFEIIGVSLLTILYNRKG